MSISDPQPAADAVYDAQALERAAQAHWNDRDRPAPLSGTQQPTLPPAYR